MSSRKLIGDEIRSSDQCLERNARMPLSYVSEDAWAEIAAETLHHADGHMAPPQAFQFLKMGSNSALGPAPLPDFDQDCFPGRGRPHPFRQTLEECDAQFGFKIENLPVYRRRRHV